MAPLIESTLDASEVSPTRDNMVPTGLPDVLPTARLNHRGVPIRSIRDELRRIPNGRNAITVLMCLAQSFGVVIAAAVVNTWWSYLAAFVLMTRGHACLNILAHEAAHRLLFSKRWANDTVGRFLLAYPTYQAFLAYRRAHFAHHRDELGPEEPDSALYAGYPVPFASWRRRLVRDATGQSGWKNMKSLGHAIRSGRTEALMIVGVQLGMLAASIAFQRPVAYVVWIASWMTVWKVSNRLRAIAEHGGMIRSRDRRKTTHVITQSLVARYWMVPYNTGWHLAHHVDMGVPFRHLPQLHTELVDSGWVTPAIEYPTYRSFWKAVSSLTTNG